jgi:hypothetical protein
VIAELAAHAGVQAGASVRAISPEIPEDPEAESEVIIQSVTRSGTTTPVNPDQVRGTVDVRMSVARGAADALQVHLVRPDGSTILLERCTQDFGDATGTVTAADLRVMQAQSQQAGTVDVVCSINTADYDLVDGQGMPRFANEDYRVRARLVSNGEVLDQATSGVLTFDNVDFVDVELETAADARDAQGRLWHGGALTATAIPVSFTGESIARVTFTADNGATRTDTDGSDGFSVTFPLSGTQNVGGVVDTDFSVTATTITTGGQDGPSAESESIRFDTRAPTVDEFVLAGFRGDTRWVNGAYDFDAGLRGVEDQGVGRVSVQYYYATAGADNRAAAIISRGTAVDSPAEIPQSDVNTRYVAAAVISDALGNTTRVALDGRFGVDLTAPSAGLAAQTGNVAQINPQLRNDALGEMNVRGSDEVSGPRVTHFWVYKITNAGEECIDQNPANEDGCDARSIAGGTQNLDINELEFDGEAYYRIVARVDDRAGNRSATVSTRLFIMDTTGPSVTGIANPDAATLRGGQQYTWEATIRDNVDLSRNIMTAWFNNPDVGLIHLSAESISPFGTPIVDQQRVAHTVRFIRAAERADNMGTLHGLTQVVSYAIDHAGWWGGRSTEGLAGRVEAGRSFQDRGVNATSFSTSRNTLTDDNPTATLTFQVRGATGTFANPFAEVRFERRVSVQFPGGTGVDYWQPVDASPQVRSTDTGTGTTGRAWTFTSSVGAAGTYRAIGISADGDALVSGTVSISDAR